MTAIVSQYNCTHGTLFSFCFPRKLFYFLENLTSTKWLRKRSLDGSIVKGINGKNERYIYGKRIDRICIVTFILD